MLHDPETCVVTHNKRQMQRLTAWLDLSVPQVLISIPLQSHAC